jgi:hypothetical protein
MSETDAYGRRHGGKITAYLTGIVTAAVVVLAFSNAAQAAPNVMDHPGGTLEQRRACKDDAIKFCRQEIPDIPRITACMTKNKKNLSAMCRTQFK